jgi:hypothetical protein
MGSKMGTRLDVLGRSSCVLNRCMVQSMLMKDLHWAYTHRQARGSHTHLAQYSLSRWVIDIYHPNLVTCLLTLLILILFLENLQLFSRHYMSNAMILLSIFSLIKKAIYLNMFGPIMLDRVIGNINCRLVITI